MYYLEDQHSEYEYTCYVQVRNAQPYVGIWYGTDMMDVLQKIAEIEKKHSRYKQHFYIDNDFYDNIYHNNDYVYYYRFLKRKVNDRETVSERKNLFKIV